MRRETQMTTLRTAALALAVTVASAPAHAGVKATAINPGYWQTTSSAEDFVPLDAAGATTLTFNLASGGKKVLTFSAACAVDTVTGETYAWLNFGIYVNGIVVEPTGDSSTALCSANRTGGFDGNVRGSITLAIQGIAGTNTIRIKANLGGYATGAGLSDSILLIYD